MAEASGSEVPVLGKLIWGAFPRHRIQKQSKSAPGHKPEPGLPYVGLGEGKGTHWNTQPEKYAEQA